MAPVLFLFLMSAAAKTLEIKWHEAGIKTLKVVHACDDELVTGYVRGHTPHMYTSSKLTAYKIIQCLNVDSCAFPFLDQTTLILGMNLIHSHFAHLGLDVHIGRDGERSKTE